MYDAIILAGGENTKYLRQLSPQRYEAMIEIAGKPMVSFVAQALAECSHVGRIFILGPKKELAQCSLPPKAILLDGGKSILETIHIGMQALGHTGKTLVATADIPLLTPASIDDFVNRCNEKQADLYYPIIAKDVNNTRFPGNKRTYVSLREGTYTGGNIFLVNPAIVPKCLEVAEKIIENRKRPFQLARLLGWSFVLQLATGTLSLERVEKRVSELLGITGAVIRSEYPELGIDVDKPSDLELVRGVIARV